MYQFSIKGHKNITAKHKSTLEFTKEENITLNGDCILGVKANYDLNELKNFKNKLLLSFDKNMVVGYKNPSFSHDVEMVLRTSDFRSNRTFMYKCNLASNDVSRDTVKKLKQGKRLNVKIDNVKIKAVFLDFDNTLEDWNITDSALHTWLFSELAKITKLSLHTVTDNWFRAKETIKQFNTLKKYNRKFWFKEFFKISNVKVQNKVINELEDKYWEIREEEAVLFPNLKKILSQLRKKYMLVLISDSDGKKEYKYNRIRKFGIEKYFDEIILGDDVNAVKPNPIFFHEACKRLKIKPYEAIMVGDHPASDHISAKPLGITTVWIRKGRWAAQIKSTPNYVDYVIDDLSEVIKIAKDLK